MATKKQSKKIKQKARIRKAKPWIAMYQGKNIIESYCRAFKVDQLCAEKDLEAMGAATVEQREQLRQEEVIRKQNKREETSARLLARMEKHGVDTDKIKSNPADIKRRGNHLRRITRVIKNQNPNADVLTAVRLCANNLSD